MPVEPVTPKAGLTSIITIGGTAAVVIPPLPNGGIITNPSTPADQGLVATEPLYIDPVSNAGLLGNGTTFALQPGQSWTVIPGQTTPTSINAASTGHKFSVVQW